MVTKNYLNPGYDCTHYGPKKFEFNTKESLEAPSWNYQWIPPWYFQKYEVGLN